MINALLGLVQRSDEVVEGACVAHIDVCIGGLEFFQSCELIDEDRGRAKLVGSLL